MSQSEINSWKDVEFIIQSTDAVIEDRYKDAISIMCEGLDNKIESKSEVNSDKLLRATYLLFTVIRKKSEEKLDFQFEKKVESQNIDKCGFCGKKRSEVVFLFGGANAYICDSCVKNCNQFLEN